MKLLRARNVLSVGWQHCSVLHTLFGHAWVRSSMLPQTITRPTYSRPALATLLVSTKVGNDAHVEQHTTSPVSNAHFRCPRCGYDGLCISRCRWYDAFRGALTRSKPYRCAVCRARRVVAAGSGLALTVQSAKRKLIDGLTATPQQSSGDRGLRFGNRARVTFPRLTCLTT